MMTVDRYVRLVAGLLVTASVLLGMTVHPGFYWLAAFVGLNLLQSAFSNWCPLISLLKAAGVRS
jgi:hypothetical protein